MHCQHYDDERCRSCQWLNKVYSQQVSDKQRELETLLAPFSVPHYFTPVVSRESAFRNKAKMVVSGSVEKPILGIVSPSGDAVDLCDCPLYPSTLQAVFPIIKTFIARAGLTPYNVERKKGELKFILLTQNESGDFMLRFVLRSEMKLAQLKSALPWLLEQLPQLKVVSANIQPVHMAILEGEKEIALTEQSALAQRLNQVRLFIRPGSFFQTNTAVAEKLYATAQDWVNKLPVTHLWDLFCGVGGFGLHCANKQRKLTGIEINADAIACARQSAELLGLTDISFDALDSTKFALSSDEKPELIIVNPPRRGIGAQLCSFLNELKPQYVLYSSCNAKTMAKDIERLNNYHIERVQLFDMFPHTSHYEVLVLLVINN